MRVVQNSVTRANRLWATSEILYSSLQAMGLGGSSESL